MMASDTFPSMKHHLAIASPSLVDFNFCRSVVFIAEHTEEGAFGLILNRPLNLKLRDVFSKDEHIEVFPEVDMVWFGGPVDIQRGLFLHAIPQLPMQHPLTIGDDLFICGELETAKQLSKLRAADQITPPLPYRFFLGYAGWGPGQLEQEIRAGNWQHCVSTNALLFETPSEDLWEKALQSLGIDPAALVDLLEGPPTLQ